MSGPKGGGYSIIESPAQIEARMLRSARAEYEAAHVEWLNVEFRAEAVRRRTGERLDCVRPDPPGQADSAGYRRAAEDLRAAAGQVVEQLRMLHEAVAGQRYDELIARLAGQVNAEVHEGNVDRTVGRWKVPRESEASGSRAAAIDRATVAARVRRRLEALAQFDHDSDVVAALIADIATAGTESRIDMLVREIDLLVEDARAATVHAASVAATATVLAEMRCRLEDLPSEAAAGLRCRVADLATAAVAELPPDLPALVNDAVLAAEAEASRQRVATVVADALEQLGYRVGPEFCTGIVGAAGTGYARNGSSHFGIKFRLEPHSARFSAQAVKSDAVLTSVQEDATAERDFCGTLEKAVELARRSGIELELDIRTPAGKHQVQQVAAAELDVPAMKSTAGVATAKREQRLP